MPKFITSNTNGIPTIEQGVAATDIVAGVPYNASGNIVGNFSSAAPAYVQNGLPFDSNNALAAEYGGTVTNYQNGLGFTANGRLAVGGDGASVYQNGNAFNVDRLQINVAPSLSFSFLASTSLTSPQGVALTFSRASGAMQFYEDGYMDWAPENLARGSNNFSNAAYWAISNFTVTDNAIYNPATGAVDGATMYETAAAASIHQNGVSTVFALPLGEYVTVTVDMAAIGDRQGYIGSNSGAFGTTEFCYYNLIDGTLGTVGSSVINPGITPLGINPADGKPWYRCRWTCKTISAGTTPTFFILSTRTTDTSRAPAYDGDVNKGIAVGRINVSRGRHYGVYLPTTTAIVYGMRSDYDPSKTYYENQNLNVWSEDQTNAGYTKVGCTIARFTENPPAGVTTYSKIQEDTSTGLHRVFGSITNVVAGQKYTMQVRIKAAERNFAFVQLANASLWNGGNPGLFVDLTTGAISGFNGVSYSVMPDVNGFWKVTITAMCISSGTTNGIIVHAATSLSTTSYPGTSGFGIYCGGFALNVGVQASAYVFTEASAVNGNPVAPARGLQIEEAATNILLSSSRPTDAVWVKSDLTVASNTTDVLSPMGLFNASKITAGSTLADQIYQEVAITAGNYVISYTVQKRGNHDWIRTTTADTTTTDGFRAWYNLSTGVKGTLGIVGAGTALDSGMIDIGGGWYICWAIGTVGAAATTCRFYHFACDANNSTARVSGGIRYVDGSQLVQMTPSAFNASTGRVFSYIPTTSAAATRSADLPLISVASPWYNQDEGTIVAVFEPSYINSNAASRGCVVSLEVDSSNHHRILSSVASNAKANTTVAGVNQSDFASPTLVSGAVNKMVYAYKTNDFEAYFNGSSLGTDVSGTVPAGALTAARLGNRVNDFLNGWLSYIAYYPTRLPGATMATL